MMKRVAIVLMIIALVTTGLNSMVFAEVGSSIYTKEKMETLVRQKLNIDSEMTLMYSNLTTQDTRQKKFWDMTFQNEDTHVSITAEAERGWIIRFNQWNYDYYNRVVTVLPEDAKKIAIEFIQGLEPVKFRETEEVKAEAPSMILYDFYRSIQEGQDYYFMFVRKIKDEFFPNNYFRVQVSGVSGEIIGYEMNWDDAIYQDNKPLINEGKARSIFEGENRLSLRYVQLQKDNGGDIEKPVLTPVYIYQPKESDMISAIDGRLLTREEIYNHYYFGPVGYRAMKNMTDEETADSAYYGGSGMEMVPEAGVMSKEAAERLVMEMLSKELDMEGMRLQYSHYTNRHYGIKGRFWSFNWWNDEGNASLEVVLDADDKEIVSVNYSKSPEKIEYRSNQRLEIMKQEVITKASKKIKGLFPNIQDTEIQLEVKSSTEDGLVYIETSRYINNIPYDGNYIHLTYSVDKDEILKLHTRWTRVDAKYPRNLIKEKEITKKFYDTVGFEKYLIQLSDLEARDKDKLDIPKRELLPIYTLKNWGFSYINAEDGKFLDYSGEEYKEEVPRLKSFDDIDHNPYRDEIILMDKMGILQENDNSFRPDETLQRQDALKWIVEMGWRGKVYHLNRYYRYDRNTIEEEVPFKDIDVNHPYYQYVKAGVENGVIEKTEDYFKPSERIEKIEITKWLLNAMDQKKLAQFTEIFKVSYSDIEVISPEDIGYAALAKYYNLFNDRELVGEFQPDSDFTRGKFISILYNFIKNQ